MQPVIRDTLRYTAPMLASHACMMFVTRFIQRHMRTCKSSQPTTAYNRNVARTQHPLGSSELVSLNNTLASSTSASSALQVFNQSLTIPCIATQVFHYSCAAVVFGAPIGANPLARSKPPGPSSSESSSFVTGAETGPLGSTLIP